MRFQCEFCQAPYVLPDERIRGKVLKIRCKKCKSVMTVKGPQIESLSADPTLPDPSIPKNVSTPLPESSTLFPKKSTPSPIKVPPPHFPSVTTPKPKPAVSHSTTPSTSSVLDPQNEDLPSDSPTPSTVEDTIQAEKESSDSHPASISDSHSSPDSSLNLPSEPTQRPLPKPKDQWLEEMERDLDRPITQEIDIKELAEVQAYLDIRPWHVRYLPYLLALLFIGGLLILMWPQPKPELPGLKKKSKSQEVIVQLSPEQLKKAKQVRPSPSDQSDSITKGSSSTTSSPQVLDPSQGDKKEKQNPQTEKKKSTSSKQKQASTKTSSSKISKTPAKKTSAKKATAKKTTKKAKRKTTRKSTSSKALSGALSKAEIQSVLNQNSGGLQYCYRKLRKKEPNLGGIQGTLSFTVQPDGRPQASSIRLKRVNRRNQRFENCIKSAVRRWYFPKKSKKTKVNYPMSFTPSF